MAVASLDLKVPMSAGEAIRKFPILGDRSREVQLFSQNDHKTAMDSL